MFALMHEPLGRISKTVGDQKGVAICLSIASILVFSMRDGASICHVISPNAYMIRIKVMFCSNIHSCDAKVKG